MARFQKLGKVPVVVWLCLAGAGGYAVAQEVRWGPVAGASPSGRCCVGLAFDQVQHATILFGGSTSGGGGTSNDTWLWSGNAWSQLSPAHSPSVRQGPGMVWDGAAGNIVLFGGTDASGQPLNDTWTWDGNDWTQQFPPVSPPPRRFDANGMAFDAATGTVVIFGGTIGNNTFLGDTWSWDGVQKTWTQSLPATSPSPRRTTLAFDYNSRVLLLFGGDDSASWHQDTWIWDGVNWTEQFPKHAPSSRTMGAMVWDRSMQAIFLFGGRGSATTTFNDTWAWKGGDWIQAAPVGNVPTARWSAGADFDPVSKAMVMFGGFNFVRPLSGTWLLFPAR